MTYSKRHVVVQPERRAYTRNRSGHPATHGKIKLTGCNVYMPDASKRYGKRKLEGGKVVYVESVGAEQGTLIYMDIVYSARQEDNGDWMITLTNVDK